MKRCFMYGLAVAIGIAGWGCKNKAPIREEDPAPMRVIFETDLGNDVDDAMALDLLYKYMDAGKVDLLAVMINKVEDGAVELADIYRTWYGYPDVPIGGIVDGADCSKDGKNYAQAVAEMVDAEGKPLFKRSSADSADYPLAVNLYREILAAQPDTSVTIISTGFSTNLARLLESQADGFSPLDGRELVAAKVKDLVVMAGNIADPTKPEYNVMKDVPAARKVFSEWPTPLVTSPFEVGIAANYPGKSIEEDFNWAPLHPMVEAYKAYLPMPYDRPTWDLTSVLYAVEGVESLGVPYFTLQGPGEISVTDDGCTFFSPDPEANRFYLTVDSVQVANILGHFKEILTTRPASIPESSWID